MMKFWFRIATYWDMPVLVKDTYALVKTSCLPWLGFIKEILNNTGYSYVWDHPEYIDPGEFIPELKQRLIDQYIQHWTEELQGSTGKLRTYKMIKLNFSPEKYLELAPHLRIQVAKLRSSCHQKLEGITSQRHCQ